MSLVGRVGRIALGVAAAAAGIISGIPWFVWFGVGFVILELARGRESYALIAGIWFFGLGAVLLIDTAILGDARDWSFVIPLVAAVILCSLGALFARGHFRVRALRERERRSGGDTS